MKIKRKITRILVTLMWVILASGLTVLLVAAIEIKNRKTCRQVKINITGVKDFSFLNDRDILQIVSENGMNHPVGKPIEEFNLQDLETIIRKNVWVKNAQLFFDNNLVLHVSVTEREPVARVFDTDDASFYIDSTGYKIPLGNKRLMVRLPVFTGFPTYVPDSKHADDSMLISHMKDVSRYIMQDSFWMAQIAQIDITEQKTFEMVPTFGNHVIEFGDGENYISKFNRLMVFYKQILGKYGFDRYTRISVRYNSQIIGTKKGDISRIDSLQALKNIQQMIDEAKVITTDSMPPLPVVSTAGVKNKTTDSATHSVKVNTIKSGSSKPAKVLVPVNKPIARTAAPANRVINATKPNANTSGVKPKAVMPRLN